MAPMGAIEMSALGQAMRQWLWLYPAVETVHLVGVALLFGSIAVFDLRLLGLSRSIPLRRLAAHGCQAYQGYLYGRPQPAACWPARVD